MDERDDTPVIFAARPVTAGRITCLLLGHAWCDCNERCAEHAGDTFRCSGYGNCASPHPGQPPAHCRRCGFAPPGQARTEWR